MTNRIETTMCSEVGVHINLGLYDDRVCLSLTYQGARVCAALTRAEGEQMLVNLQQVLGETK